jgi:hypothetical protein
VTSGQKFLEVSTENSEQSSRHHSTWEWAAWGHMIERTSPYFHPPTYPPLQHTAETGRTKRKDRTTKATVTTEHGTVAPPSGEVLCRPAHNPYVLPNEAQREKTGRPVKTVRPGRPVNKTAKKGPVRLYEDGCMRTAAYVTVDCRVSFACCTTPHPAALPRAMRCT